MLAPLLALALLAPDPADLTTTAERTGFAETGRYDEAVRLCHAFERAFPRRARCTVFGTTPEGRPMVALAASADGVLDPAAARRRGRPVVLFQGGIHAGEIDGKDAGFLVLRELLSRKDGGPLAKVTAVFVPVLNVDGHERFGVNNRPNQRGPREMGWRVTAQNYNLNRDFTKADAPETQAIVRLLLAWDPVVFADLHVTDGAKFEHDVSVTMEPRFGYAPSLRPLGLALTAAMMERLTAAGHLPVDFYPSFRDDKDPASGFAYGAAGPRFANDYWAAHNRLGILVETHSWRTYPERVKATADALRALLDRAAADGVAWRAAMAAADAEPLGGREVPLAYTSGSAVRIIFFRGYAYAFEPSPALGRPVVRYDESRPQAWTVPLVTEVRPSVSAVLPTGGWIVPAAYAARLGPKLALHGVRTEPLAAGDALEVEEFRATTVTLRAEPYEGRQTASVTGAWRAGRRELGAGALFVPVAQPGALLAAYLLEPTSPDSFLAWGDFNGVFERKEYIEDYALEPFARELLDRDAAVRAAFEERLKDPAFAGDPAARLDFFYERHPAFDDRYRLYPVVRVSAPVAQALRLRHPAADLPAGAPRP